MMAFFKEWRFCCLGALESSVACSFREWHVRSQSNLGTTTKGTLLSFAKRLTGEAQDTEARRGPGSQRLKLLKVSIRASMFCWVHV